MNDLTWVDWAIVIVVALSVFGGLAQGFFRSVCSLGGLILGLALAAWNYRIVAAAAGRPDAQRRARRRRSDLS